MQKQGSSKFKLHNERSFVMTKRILAGLVVAAFLLSCSLALASDGPLSYQTANVDGKTVVKLFLQNTELVSIVDLPMSFEGNLVKVDFTGSRFENFSVKIATINDNTVHLGLIRDIGPDIADALQPGEGLLATFTFGSSVPSQLSVTPIAREGGGEANFQMLGPDGKIVYEQTANKAPVSQTKGTDDSKRIEFGVAVSPNPFNPSTAITVSADNEIVTVRVYNVLGQKVKTLVDGERVNGQRTFIWNGTNEAGGKVATGVYFVRAYNGVKPVTQQISLVK
jgi:hypothetical protein